MKSVDNMTVDRMAVDEMIVMLSMLTKWQKTLWLGCEVCRKNYSRHDACRWNDCALKSVDNMTADMMAIDGMAVVWSL